MFIRCLESSNQDIVNIALKNLAEFVLFAQGKSSLLPVIVITFALLTLHRILVSEVLSFAYPFPDVAALTDLPYISRSSAVRPIYLPLTEPHPSPNISLAFLCFFGLSLFLLVLISQVFGVFLCPKYTVNTPESFRNMRCINKLYLI